MRLAIHCGRLGLDHVRFSTTNQETPRHYHQHTEAHQDIHGDPGKLGTVVTSASSYENRANLSQTYYQQVIAPYEGTRLGRQEILGEVLDDVPGALWKRGWIDAARIGWDQIRWDLNLRIVVAIDPAVSSGESSDETGIICVALTNNGHCVVLDDLSCKDTPLGWGRIAVSLLLNRAGDRIVGERNNGGDLVESNLRAVNPNIPYRSVWASRGKAVRAEPVAALYEQGRVHHAGSLGKLEDEMCAFVPGTPAKPSPNRMDALVWAITELFGLDGEDTRPVVVQRRRRNTRYPPYSTFSTCAQRFSCGNVVSVMQLGIVIERWRWAMRISIRDASKMIGISPATLSRIENGRQMDGDALSKILRWMLAEVPE